MTYDKDGNYIIVFTEFQWFCIKLIFVYYKLIFSCLLFIFVFTSLRIDSANTFVQCPYNYNTMGKAIQVRFLRYYIEDDTNIIFVVGKQNHKIKIIL